MVSRKMLYRLRQVCRFSNWLGWLGGDATRRGLLRLVQLGQHGPIVLSSGSVRNDRDASFAATTLAALALIQRYDPRRHRLIEREVRFIVNQELLSHASYDRSIRQCKIDFSRCSQDNDGNDWTEPGSPDYEWYLARYASTLVHEAVHGRVNSLGFEYIPETRARIERLCVAEQRRFLARLPREQYDFRELIPRFDLDKWEVHWRQSKWQRRGRLIQRVREQLRQSR